MSTSLDDFLEALGLDYDDLDMDEKETYHSLLKVAEQKALTIDDFKACVSELKDLVEARLTSEKAHEMSKAEQLLLTGRLANYRLMEVFLYKPEKAQQALETYFDSLKSAYKQKV